MDEKTPLIFVSSIVANSPYNSDNNEKDNDPRPKQVVPNNGDNDNDDNDSSDLFQYSMGDNDQQQCCDGGCCCHHVDGCWKWYNTMIEKRPLLVKCITATCILSCADLLAQMIEKIEEEEEHNSNYNPNSNSLRTNHTTLSSYSDVSYPSNCSPINRIIFFFDWDRMIRYGLIGFMGAPWSHYYFYYLDYYFPSSRVVLRHPTLSSSSSCCTATTFIKVIIDQFIQAPLLLAIMIITLSALQGNTIVGVRNEMQISYISSLIANCTCVFCLLFAI
jgi:hypothetical protein